MSEQAAPTTTRRRGDIWKDEGRIINNAACVCFVCCVGVWCGVMDEMLWLAYDDGVQARSSCVKREGGEGGREGGVDKESCLNNTSLLISSSLSCCRQFTTTPPLIPSPRKKGKQGASKTPRIPCLHEQKQSRVERTAAHIHRPPEPSLSLLSCPPSL